MFALGVYRRRMKAIGLLARVEEALGVPMTTRNWNAVKAVVAVAGGRR